MLKNAVEQRRSDFAASMNGYGDSPAIGMDPPLVAAALAGFAKSKFGCQRAGISSARALGMNDFCLVARRHQGVAAGNRRHFRHPSIGLVAVEHHFVVVEAHGVSSLAQDPQSLFRNAPPPIPPASNTTAAIRISKFNPCIDRWVFMSHA